MNQEAVYQTLLCTTQDAYAGNAEMTGFTPFPDDIVRQAITPFHSTCCDVFCEDKKLVSQKYPALQDALRAASDAVHWRQTYKDTDIGDDFMGQFACYCIIGENAPFMSAAIRLFMVYMPPHFYYPWHHHPAEEMYVVVSGTGVFKRKDCPDERLTEGEISFHQSNQPHAMETLDDPVLCLVAWRDDFETQPVLTPPSGMS
ncbi:dimethylsulfonioproprionate lyase family protein [Planktomarina temperata]|jgi:hypothetical protein|nr:dimethylsulfonioproprionate lyase family protein [Planktomarina temperata]MDA9939919.1 dimethylsulfonioproprionate lyase family protein [Planktomarina temperata]